MSPWFEFRNDQYCSHDGLRISIHMTRAAVCRRESFIFPKIEASAASACFHLACYRGCPLLAAWDRPLLRATGYDYPPSPAEERRRADHLADQLATRLQLLYPGRQPRHFPSGIGPAAAAGAGVARGLPKEVWLIVAGLLLRWYAPLHSWNQVARAAVEPAPEIDLRLPVYASYVKFDGRRYVRSLYNGAADELEPAQGRFRVLLGMHAAGGADLEREPVSEDPNGKGKGKAKRKLATRDEAAQENHGGMFLAQDQLGIRQIFFVSYDRQNDWRRRHPTIPGAWWSYIPIAGLGETTLEVVTDVSDFPSS